MSRPHAHLTALLAALLLLAAMRASADVVLYGISGDGSSPASTLFALNPANGAATTVGALGNGDDGEGIAFRPDNGLLYHTSGSVDGQEYLEPVNPDRATPGANLEAGNTYGPSAASEITAIAWYPPIGGFIASDVDLGFYHVTTAGAFTQVGSSGMLLRGFAVVGTRVYAVNPVTAQMHEIDPADGAILATRPLTVDAVATTGTGMATNPESGVVYAVVKNPASPTGARLLATINVATGQATSLGSTGLKLAGIAFRTHAPLFAITGDGDTPPSTLFTLDPGTGAIAFEAALGHGNDGEGLAFHTGSGLLYHTSGVSNGSEYLETIDPFTLAIGANLEPANTYGPASATEITAIGWYPPLGVFLACDANFNCFHVTAGGAFTLVGNVGLQIRGFAVVGTHVYGVSPFVQSIYELNPGTGAVIATLPLSVGGLGTTGNGLATSPDSGVVFGILKNPLAPTGGRLLARVDVATGQATSIADTGRKLAALSFGAPVPWSPPVPVPNFAPIALVVLAVVLLLVSLDRAAMRE